MVNLSLFKLSPRSILIIFSSINILIYLDRGALSSLVTDLQSNSNGGLGLSSFLTGTLGSCFILGYMITAPIFAHGAQSYHPEYLMCLGLAIWIGSVLLTGFSRNYPMLLIARSLTGIGEASFVCLAPPVILDIAPAKQKNAWIGLFYVANVLGYALGFVYGSQVAILFGAWYYPFYLEGIAMTPFLLASLFNYKDPKLYAKSETGGEINFCDQFKILIKNPVFVNLTLGFAAYTFTITEVSFWVSDI